MSKPCATRSCCPSRKGLKRESELFRKLVAGDQSKAQRHIFFAEREAAKVPGIPEGTKPRPIASGAVIGAGTMGGGIAMCFANAGIPVTIVETGRDLLQKGLDRVAANYRATVSRGGLSADEMERRIGLITGVTELEAVGSADVVIEAVFEEMDLKKRVFSDLDRLAKPNALLATNTSTLDVDEIARATKRPQDVLGTHFFSPANVMRLLEIVRGAATSPDALATAVTLGRRIGKVPVTVGVCYGFVGNRMLARRSVETERLLLEGALPQEVDAAVTGFGFPMGPFAMADMAGLDVGWRIRKGRGERNEIEDALCEAGHYGQKTGKGYFRYDAGSRTPLPDPEVEKIILETSSRLGINRRPIAQEEIVERMIFPMINEGARILEEGIAARPGDIDVIWVYGYGWPVWRGGPMYYADQLGPRASPRPIDLLCRPVARRDPAACALARAPRRRRPRLRVMNCHIRHPSPRKRESRAADPALTLGPSFAGVTNLKGVRVMDLRFTPEELAFRDEVRAFFRANLPESIRTKLVEGKHLAKDDIVTWQRILNAKGWAVANWPVEWGGTGWTPGAAIHIPGRAAADPGAAAARLWRHDGRAGHHRFRLGRAEEALFCRRSPISTFGGARAFPSLARVRISPRCGLRRSATATITSSTDRRPGRPWRSTPIGSSAWCAPIRRPRSRRVFPFC